MSGIQALREQRAARGSELKALMDSTDGQKWEKTHQEKYDTLCAEVEDIDARIGRIQKVLDLEAANAAQVRRTADERGISEDHAQAVVNAGKAMMAAWIRGGVSALNDEQISAQRSIVREIRNTMSTTTGSEGGYGIQREMGAISDAMAVYGGMRQVSEVFRTDNGSPMDYPTSNGTSEKGELIGENTTATAADPTFGTLALNTYKFSSKIITVPFELLQDASFDVEAFVRGRIEQRLGRITNDYFTTGTGTAQPNGIVTAATSGKVGASGQTTTVKFTDLIDLEHSVDPAYRANARFMFKDTTLREIKKLVDSQNRPLWLPGYTVGEPDRINGYGYTINQSMADMAANAKSVLFGDFSNYKIRDVMAMLLFRFTDSKYAEKGQVGFMAWMRSGGQFVDVGGAVKYYQNSAT